MDSPKTEHSDIIVISNILSKDYVYQFCDNLSNEDYILLKKLIRPNIYSDKEIKLFFKSLWIEPIKKCWFRSKDWSHYSQISKIPAHRFSYNLFIENLIGGKEICHKCDRRGCVNPWHLFQGTHSENMQDCRNKGRTYFNRFSP